MEHKQYIAAFIQQHRTEFDAAVPDGCLWKNIDVSLKRLQGGDYLEKLVATERPIFDQMAPSAAVWANIEAVLNQTRPAPQRQPDALEAFIQDHRDALDTHTPPPILILPEQPVAAPTLQVVWYRRMARVAAAVIFLVIGATWGLWYSSQNPQEAYVGMKMSEVSKEYAALETNYEREIASKKTQLSRFASDPSTSEVLGDLAQMDKVMDELRMELSNVPPGNREQIIRVMIQNYQAKVRVLEKVLENITVQQGIAVPSTHGAQQGLRYEKDTI